MSNMSKKTRLMVFTGVFSALSIILYFFEFPIIPGLTYLMIDVSDIPAAVAGVVLGPFAAVIVELIKVIVHVVVKGMGSTMGFGDIINFLVGSALTVTFSVFFRKMRSKSKNLYFSVVVSGLLAMATMAAMGVVGNYLIAPPYFKFVLSVELSGPALWGAIGGATILNLVKSAVLAVLMVPIMTLVDKRLGSTFNVGKPKNNT